MTTSAITTTGFDESRHKWREVTGDPALGYFVRHDYTILGWDFAAGTLDMVVRWRGDGGYCPLHRHVATTTVLVLAGEQHLWDAHPDGSRGPERVRRAGDYALTVSDPHAHYERGGSAGGLAFFGNHSNDGKLYELADEHGKLVLEVTMAALVADWQANAR
jgi:hypothetical protein